MVNFAKETDRTTGKFHRETKWWDLGQCCGSGNRSQWSRMCYISHIVKVYFPRDTGWWDSSWPMPSVSWAWEGDQHSNIQMDFVECETTNFIISQGKCDQKWSKEGKMKMAASLNKILKKNWEFLKARSLSWKLLLLKAVCFSDMKLNQPSVFWPPLQVLQLCCPGRVLFLQLSICTYSVKWRLVFSHCCNKAKSF